MAYSFYLEDELLPVTPQKLSVKVNGNNKTYTLINNGEVNVIKPAGLTDIEFEALLPNAEYGGVTTYLDGFKPAAYFLNLLEGYKKNLKPFQFIVTRKGPAGQNLNDTNITVTLENYEIVEDAKAYGLDTMVKIKLKQYKSFKTKTVKVKKKKKKSTVTTKKERMVDANKQAETNAVQTYTVKKGDCLWNIAKKFYGNGALYPKIQEANGLKNSTLIFPNQVLTIPK